MLLSPSHSLRGIVMFTGFAVLALTFYKYRQRALSEYLFADASTTAAGAEHYQPQIDFWRALEFILTSNAPGVPAIKRNANAEATRYDGLHEIPRPDLLEMSVGDVKEMAIAHENYVKTITVNPPNLVYKPGTRGVVATAGGPYLPLVVMSLRMLRRTGSKLPAEIFLGGTAEYESFICETVLPSLNAKCIILPEIMDAAKHGVEVGKYQLKIFAMIFSSFEEILFLDADAFPVYDPNKLFMSEPFKSHGLVTWPDFWAPTESKYFFSISGIKAPPSTARASSETGEILISKKTHSKTLLLASYYNYYGPGHYYPLLSQGAPGEGDKETFLAAAAALNEPAYAVGEPVIAIGHKRDGGLAGSAMVQYDPREDFSLDQQGLHRNKDLSVAKPITPFFVHVNFPKFNPARIYDDTNLVRHPNGTYRRCWVDEPEMISQFEYDVEKRYWEEAKWAACHLEGKFRDWLGYENICAKATKYFDDVFE